MNGTNIRCNGATVKCLPVVVQRLFPFYCNKTPKKPSAFGKAAQCVAVWTGRVMAGSLPAGTCCIAVRIALREGVALRLPSSEGLWGGFTSMRQLIRGSSHESDVAYKGARLPADFHSCQVLSCGDPWIRHSMEVHPPPNPSEEGSRNATPSRHAILQS